MTKRVSSKPWKACGVCRTVLASNAKGSICKVCAEVQKIIAHTPAPPKVDSETGTVFQPKEDVHDGKPAIVYSYELGGFVVVGEPAWTEGSNPSPKISKRRDERHF